MMAEPRIDVATMRRALSTAEAVMALNPPESPMAEGYRLFRVSGGDVAWMDLPANSGAYAVFGSHPRCDVKFAPGDDVCVRHLVATCCNLGDGSFGLRLMDLQTSIPFFVDDDVPRRSIVVSGPLLVRIGKHVVGGLPVGSRAASKVLQVSSCGMSEPPRALESVSAKADVDAAPPPLPVPVPSPTEGITTSHRFARGEISHITSVRPVSHIEEMIASRAKSGYVRLTLQSSERSAAVELPQHALDDGVLLGRADNCLDRGLRAVLSTHISRTHLLLLRDGAEIMALDLCSTNGTRYGGQKVRRVMIPAEGLALTLGPELTLIWHPQT
ncbi:FHA domain-containing protein [Sorangium sp. So ce131]|uniref:FHA domain-containing protein n=1 Tax=Sorangium sp. So ce131 TaxID=3133282 RepID=UPI003F616351